MAVGGEGVIVATYSVHDDQPRIMANVPHPARWLVKLWASTPYGKATDEIRNRQPCMLSELLEIAAGRSEEMLAESPEYTGAGFTVVRLR